MSDEHYTNLDLDTADELLIAAGKPELAKALRYQTQGVRNLVQGEWGQSFVSALDNIMETRVISVLTSVQLRLDEQIGLVQQILTTAREAKAIAQEALTVAKGGTARLKKLETGYRKLRQGQVDYNERLDAVIARLESDESRLDRKKERLDRDEQRLDEHDHMIAELQRIVAQRPEQRRAEQAALVEEIVRRVRAEQDDGIA